MKERKHQAVRWAEGIAALLFLLAGSGSSSAHATVESVPQITIGWYAFNASSMSNPVSSATEACLIYGYVYYPFVGLQQNPVYPTYQNCVWKYIDGATFVSGTAIPVLACPQATPAYTYNANSKMCERTPPETYTLTLTPDKATIEPGQSYTFTAKVTNQDGSPPSQAVPVSVKVEVDPTSGGHDHGETYAKRPKGSVSPASGNNELTITFSSTEISGTHTITATCNLCSNSPKTATVEVKVAGLKPIPTFPFYTLVEKNGDVIGATGLHADNHNLTPAAAGVLMRIATNYLFNPKLRVLDWRTNTMVMPPLLHVNDASLQWGGKFDIKGKWTGSHAEHKRGTSVDLRANEMVGAIPPELFEEFDKRLMKIIPGDATAEKFLRECSPNEKPSASNPNPVQHNRKPENYCVSQVDGSFDANRHYHVRLIGE